MVWLRRRPVNPVGGPIGGRVGERAVSEIRTPAVSADRVNGSICARCRATGFRDERDR
jgi:hypothetical protein